MDVMALQAREILPSDLRFLREMLYQAVFIGPGEKRPPKSIVADPSLAIYIGGWGRPGDCGLIASLDREPLGAAWARLFTPKNPGFGWIDEKTPEISMAIAEGHRNQGLGSFLLGQLLDRLAECGFDRASLSVDPRNPALRLYKRYGFHDVGITGRALTLLRDL